MSFLLALVAGLTQAASVALPWSGQPVWWLQILSLAALVVLLERSASGLRAAVLAWLFAMGWIAGSTWWLFISMHQFGGLAAPLAALAVLALSAFLALYYAAAAGLYFRLKGSGNQENRPWSAIVFAALWMLAELARDTWLTGFPWGAAAYAHIDGPWIALVQWLGVYGLGFALAVLATLLGLALIAPRRVGARVAVVIALVLLQASAWLSGQYPTASSGKLSVALLQGNIAQGEKFDNSAGVPTALAWYGQQLQASTATLVVAPETAIPLLPRQLPDGYLDALQQHFLQGPQAALVGIPLGSFEQGYSNSVIGFKPGRQPIYVYSKHHLVPFGEFTPAFFKWFTQLMNIPLGDFNRGAVGQPTFEWQGQRLAVNICYEDLFGDELAARFIDAESAPSILVNISNIAWFGDSVAIDQHLAISRMRAIELARPMIRATNTGPTVIIDHRGQVTHSLPRLTRGVLAGEVDGRTGITPFAWWAARFGLWPLWLLGIAIVLIAAYAEKTRA